MGNRFSPAGASHWTFTRRSHLESPVQETPTSWLYFWSEVYRTWATPKAWGREEGRAHVELAALMKPPWALAITLVQGSVPGI